MKKTLSILTVVALIVVMGLSGCTATAPSGKGTVEVLVTDAPPKDEVTSIVVTASKVEIHKAGVGEDQPQPTASPTAVPDEDGWLTIAIPEGSREFDLLKIKGVEALLAKGEVGAGKYTQIRLIVDKIQVALGGGALKPAEVPSGELKFVQPFDVVAGEATVILMDFDADKSVNITGNDKIQVKPVIKLSVRAGKTSTPGDKTKEPTEVKSQEIALDFLKKEATFVFDGIADTLKLVETKKADTPYIWTFIYDFSSAHGGYGDRTGKVVTEAITPHRAVIKVEQGKVVYAVLDNRWDMMTQETVAINIDEKQVINVSSGGDFTIALDANITTGYSWTESHDSAVLSLLHKEYRPDEKAGGLVGAGGTQYYTFRALKKGEPSITFNYRRPFETPIAQQKIFNVSVK